MTAGKGFIYTAQLNSRLSSFDRTHIGDVMKAIRRAVETARLDILIAGGEEIPELYKGLTENEPGSSTRVFLWYPVLSDYPSMLRDHETVNYRGERSAGWDASETQEAIGETFAFACPNNPGTRASTIAGLEDLLDRYPFAGVFLDKIRFPSPANGLEQLFTCFCPYCQAEAAQEGLDLDEVQALLTRIAAHDVILDLSRLKMPQPGWLEALIGMLPQGEQEILARFMRFRADSITRLVEEIRGLTDLKAVPLALDLFSPGLAYLVGQDYPALARLADWVKPMSYRYAIGPAGLRLEIPQLVRDLEKLLALAPGAAEEWMRSHVTGMAGSSIDSIERDGAPLALITAETARAVEWSGSTPVYMGVEAVSIPAFQIHITPEHIREMLSVARGTGAQGVVLSWDLLNMPDENLLAVHH